MEHLARLLVVGLLITPISASAAVLLVDPDSSNNSIQAAIDAASPGDEVLVLPGVFFETLVLRDEVNLTAQTAGTVTIDAEGEGHVVTAIEIGASTTIEGFRFQNGSAEEGGGLFASASHLTIRNCVFESNSAIAGGGVHVGQASTAVFENCTFTHNSASVGAGLYLDFSPVHLVGCSISNNEALNDGAAISANHAAEATIEYTSVHGNRSRNGAILACTYASPRFKNCTVASNSDDAGGGVFALRGSGTRIEKTIVAFNAGPALLCDRSAPWIDCSNFFGNADDSLCGGDQGTNSWVDPLFCDLPELSFELQESSPLVGTACGTLGAYLEFCPNVTTALERLTWSAVKTTFRR